MNKLNLSNPITIITIVCFLGATFFGVMFSWPKFQELKETRKNITNVEQVLKQREAYFLELEKYKNRLEGHQEELAKIASALPDDAELNLPSIFRFLQKASAETGLFLIEIEPFTISPIEERPEIKKIQFGFQVKGPYTAFKIFLNKLERSARIIKVENISFSSPDEGELFTFNVRIRVHSY